MGEFVPAWLGKELAGKNDEFLPSWLTTELNDRREEAAQINDMIDEVVNRSVAKGNQEGDFTAQMMAEVRSHESPNHGYNDYFGRGFSRGPVAPPKNLTEMTVNEVSAWQIASNPSGNDTSAAGGYQIINKTLKDLVRTMKLTGDELFTVDLQDQMAITLMKRRGLDKFLAGVIDRDTFAAGMAREWASLPVLKADRRGKRDIAIGQSYYTGDGVNKAFQGEKQLDNYKEVYALANIGE